ncbi:39S ribosomal protein L51, mitochondrial [Nilaparvata lugens]|uniref:39S ribosomal protein L51, mitochondrial n=1 Tax=Nilaparvata lugens TaxID=108931 RepID=UPI00193E283D|nr:39S ribosomal protein L51, mitochondrial [Nilaparvata lugens]
MSWCLRQVSQCVQKLWAPQAQQVRYRYHKDKLEKGKFIRRFGYEESLLQRGLLPHVDGPRLPMPIYEPKNSWSESKALFGQNDYIDILGNENLHPTRTHYQTASWLRGVKGNELQVLIRKKKFVGKGIFPISNPLKWRNLNKRVQYLYKFMNRKTNQFVFNKE